ncbi:hypothetical protein PWR66_04205 [Paraburkholderia sp. A1RO-5]|uniref:hypothetical protein n=1 Tax=Paraburkholderia sp. A1RO-5 TaxID=3028369 RepID=UPI003B7F657F
MNVDNHLSEEPPLPGVARRRQRDLRASSGTPGRASPDVRHKLYPAVGRLQHQREQAHAFRAHTRSSAQRCPHGQAARAIKELGTAHAGPARSDQLDDRRWKGFGCTPGWQRERDEFETKVSHNVQGYA